MVVTPRALLEHDPLGLRLLAGEERLDTPIRWVHVSEVLDPTPWLQGGELLLTTGLRLTDDASMHDYVDRLADHQIAGVGFGTGTDPVTIYEEVPASFVAAARRRNLPLLVVPFDTPYVAISEFVSARLAAEQYSTVQRAFDAQRRLTAAANPGDPARVIRLLTRLIDGWCVVTTAEGTVLEAVPSSAAGKVPRYEKDIQRVRSGGGVASIGEAGGKSTAVHPLGAQGRPRRLLVVGKDSPFSEFDRIVIAAAAALLSIETERRLSLSSERHQLQEYLGGILLRQGTTSAERTRLLGRLGFRSRSTFRVARLVHQGASFATAKLVHDVFSEVDIPALCVADPAHPGHYLVLCQERVSGTIQQFRELHRELNPAKTSIGVSEALPPGDLDRGLQQALLALWNAESSRAGFIEFDGLRPFDLLLGAVPTALLDGLQSVALAPVRRLEAGGDGQTVAALEAFLRFNGAWGAAAGFLGVHRQTLVKRVREAERLLGLDLDSPDERAGLWLAFSARNVLRQAAIDTPPGGGGALSAVLS